jgi:D-alanyl-D-alanine carboxypeptidase
MSRCFASLGLPQAALLLAVLGLLRCGGGNTSSKSSSGSCPPLTTPISSSGSIAAVVDPVILNEMQSQKLVGMSLAIAKNGTILYSHGYGYLDLGTCQPVQPATEFQIGSVTKQFTAAAVLQLQNTGALNVDSPLAGYLPSYSFNPRITLRMLLNQTSGLKNYLDFPAASSWIKGVSESTVLTQIAQAPLLFTPGTAYAYSNSNYFVLGSVIEAVSSVTYENYMATHIFQPIGLAHTSDSQPTGIASPYTGSAKGPVPGLIPDPSLFFAAGALWSNVQELATWDAALRDGNVIPSALVTLMVTPPAVPNYPQGGPSEYAMGWGSTPQLGRPFVWHNGETYSYTAFNGMFLDDGFSVSVLTNTTVNENIPLWNLGQQLINAVCTSPATAGSC